MKRLLTTLAAALAAMVAAAPVAAQVSAPGLVGEPACRGTSEINTFNLAEVTNITANSARFAPKNVNNLYGQLRATAGDGGPTSFPIRYTVHNAKTGARQGPYNLGTVDSTNPNFGGSSQNASYPTKTPHYFTVYTTASGWGDGRPLTRRCFMTGGSYNVTDGFISAHGGTASGCFQLSDRSDIRNCLCGRATIWNDDTRNTAQRQSLGCANL